MSAKKQQKMDVDWFMNQMEKWFSMFPPLPKNVREMLVKYAPWVALIFGVLGVLMGLAATGILTVLSPLMFLFGGFGIATGGIFGSILLMLSSFLMLMAYAGLKSMKMEGWKWMFYAQSVSVLSMVVASNLGPAILGAVVGYYLLFQVKSHYK